MCVDESVKNEEVGEIEKIVVDTHHQKYFENNSCKTRFSNFHLFIARDKTS